MRPIDTQELCEFLTKRGIAYERLGSHRQFWEPAQFERSTERNLVWFKKFNGDVQKCPAPVIVLPRAVFEQASEIADKTLIFVDDPRNAFRIVVLDMFAEQCAFSKGLKDPRLFKNPTEGVWIGQSSIVASDVVLGENTIIHPNVIIYPNVKLGNNVEILPGSVIGAPGFGHVRQPDDTLEPFPHIGGVVIGNDVMVGSNTCIDCGGLSPTVVGDGVRIGNLTQIAHNVHIERNCLVGTRVQVAGGTRVGEGTEIWAGVTISNNRRIGRHCVIKIGSIVVTHLPEKSEVSGNFAIPHERNWALFNELRNQP